MKTPKEDLFKVGAAPEGCTVTTIVVIRTVLVLILVDGITDVKLPTEGDDTAGDALELGLFG